MHDTQVIDNKNENIEILRAIAILFVMVVHLKTVLAFPSASYSWLTNNFEFSIGVDLFFVISGFVITRSLANSFSLSNAARLSIVVAFWIKRIFRLFPAAFFWLLLIILYFGATGSLWDGHSLQLRKLIPIAAAFANIFNFYSTYCFANPTEAYWCNIFFFHGHYWSLSLEYQFYIVFPFIFILFKKHLLIGLMVILIVAQFFWFRPFGSYGSAFRIDGFCWGILLALLPVTRWNIPGIDRFLNNKTAVLIFSFVLVFLLPLSASHVLGWGGQGKTYGVALVAAISAALVFIATRDEKCFGNWQPYRRLMLYIGSRSYSLYITHLIVYTMVRHLWSVIYGNTQFSDIEKKLANIAIVISSLVIIIVATEITYRIIELKFRLKGRELAKDYMRRRSH